MQHDEVVDFIRKNNGAKPWPAVHKDLIDLGCTEEDINEAMDEVFPGQEQPNPVARIRAGMVGALIGIILWAVFAAIYRYH
ncbi:MAG: hypothetical protein WC881_04895 [Elusimicrobiota bacterium]